MHLGSGAAKVPVKVQSNWKSLNPNLDADIDNGFRDLVNNSKETLLNTSVISSWFLAYFSVRIINQSELTKFFTTSSDLWHLETLSI